MRIAKRPWACATKSKEIIRLEGERMVEGLISHLDALRRFRPRRPLRYPAAAVAAFAVLLAVPTAALASPPQPTASAHGLSARTSSGTPVPLPASPGQPSGLI